MVLKSKLIASNSAKPFGSVGYELLSTLVERQFMLDQSAILDCVAGTQSIRDQWKNYANSIEQTGA
jgi:hypothetical protein